MNRTACLLGIALIAVGCSKPDVTVSGANGETVQVNGNTTTVTGKDGEKIEVKTGKDGVTTTSSNGTKTEVSPDKVQGTDDKGNAFAASVAPVSEKDLGIPFYPGSAESPNGSLKSTTGKLTTFLCTRTTEDEPQKVTAFYKSKLTDSNTINMSTGMQASQITGKIGADTEVVISATHEGSNPLTRIVISVNRKDK